MLFDRHEIILTEGAETESFHPGRQAVSALGADVQAELVHLFPDLEPPANRARRC